MILVGSYYKALYRNHRQPTKMMVLVVEGRLPTRSVSGLVDTGTYEYKTEGFGRARGARDWQAASAQQRTASYNSEHESINRNYPPQVDMEADRRPYIEDSSLVRGPSPLPCSFGAV